MSSLRIGLVTSIGMTLDAFFPEIVRDWREAGHVVEPLAGTTSAMGGTVEPSVTRQPRLRNLRAPRRLNSWAEEKRLDVVITNTATASALARLANMPCPVVYFSHGLHWNRQTLSSLPVRATEMVLLHKTKGVVTINADDERWFRRHARGVPVLRLQTGVGLDLDRFPRSPMPSDGLRLLWIGGFTDRKRPLDAVQVADQLKRAGVDFSLRMLGTGPLLEAADRQRIALGLTSHVTLAGHQPVTPFLEDANVVLHTARWEGLPRVLLEAVAVGRPVVAYDVKGVRDIPGVILTKEETPQAMSRKLLDFVNDGGLAEWGPLANEPLSFHAVAHELARFMHQVVESSRD